MYYKLSSTAFKSRYYLFSILVLGLIIRLLLVVSLPANLETIQKSGGDEFWYLVNGYALVAGIDQGTVYDFKVDVSVLPVAPLYGYFVGIWQQFLSFENAILAIRIVQAVLNILVCYFSYYIGTKLSNDKRIGLLSATALTFSLAMIYETTNILTETLYMFLLMFSLSLYIKWLIVEEEKSKYWLLMLVGAIFGLATLTRAVSLLFPLGLVLHIGLVLGVSKWRQVILAAMALILSYSLVIGTWTAYNWFKYQRFVIVSNQFMPSVWRGALEESGSPRENDATRGQLSYTEQTSQIISSDPLGYVQKRVGDLLNAYAQPHGTVHFGSQSLKAMVTQLFKQGLSLQAVGDLLNGEGFWPKLIIYIWHYTSLIAGLIGMWLTRKNWRISLVLIGFIAYTSLVHLISLALPRYIFPTYPIWWIFAAVSLVALWDRFHLIQKEIVE